MTQKAQQGILNMGAQINEETRKEIEKKARKKALAAAKASPQQTPQFWIRGREITLEDGLTGIFLDTCKHKTRDDQGIGEVVLPNGRKTTYTMPALKMMNAERIELFDISQKKEKKKQKIRENFQK